MAENDIQDLNALFDQTSPVTDTDVEAAWNAILSGQNKNAPKGTFDLDALAQENPAMAAAVNGQLNASQDASSDVQIASSIYRRVLGDSFGGILERGEDVVIHLQERGSEWKDVVLPMASFNLALKDLKNGNPAEFTVHSLMLADHLKGSLEQVQNWLGEWEQYQQRRETMAQMANLIEAGAEAPLKAAAETATNTVLGEAMGGAAETIRVELGDAAVDGTPLGIVEHGAEAVGDAAGAVGAATRGQWGKALAKGAETAIDGVMAATSEIPVVGNIVGFFGRGAKSLVERLGYSNDADGDGVSDSDEQRQQIDASLAARRDNGKDDADATRINWVYGTNIGQVQRQQELLTASEEGIAAAESAAQVGLTDAAGSDIQVAGQPLTSWQAALNPSTREEENPLAKLRRDLGFTPGA